MRAVLSLFALILLIGPTGAASAQESTVDREQAKEYFRAGKQSYDASQYAVAAEAFEQAYSLLPIPAIAFSTAQAYRLQYFVDQTPSRLKRATELYRRYIEEVPSGGRRQDAITSLAELEPILLRLNAQEAESGRGPIESTSMEARTHIMITSSVRDAIVRLDDGEPSTAPLDRDVQPGKFRVRVSAEGYFPYDEVRTVTQGQFHLVPVQLAEKPARLRFSGAAGASVSIDGRPAGTLPLARDLELSPGEHLISVKERGHVGWSKVVEVGRGEKLVLNPSLKRTRQRTFSYAIGGSSVLSLGVGTLLLLQGSSSNRDAKKLEERREDVGLSAAEFADYQTAIDDRDDQVNLGLGFLAAGGILAVAGGLLYLVDMPGAEAQAPRAPERDESEDRGEFEPMALVPTLGPEVAGLALTGRF